MNRFTLMSSAIVAAAGLAVPCFGQWVPGAGTLYTSNDVGIGTNAPRTPLDAMGSDPLGIVRAEQSNTSGAALLGWAKAVSGLTYGVYAQNASTGGYGVFGWTTTTTGNTVGVYGRCDSTAGYAGLFRGGRYGVYAWPTAETGQTVGVFGVVSSPDGWGGIFRGGRYGVWGEASPEGYAGYFLGRVYAAGRVGINVGVPQHLLHISGGDTTTALVRNIATTGTTVGLAGESASPSGYGLQGTNGATTGTGAGVIGTTVSSQGWGVQGSSLAVTGSAAGVYGACLSPAAYGVYGLNPVENATAGGVYGLTLGAEADGVFGSHDATSGNGNGVAGSSSSPEGAGVYGFASSTTGTAQGVLGISDAESGDGVRGSTSATGQFAFGVYCVGKFAATGTKAFQIDHPLDPANKVLNHYCAEGPQPYLMYRGNIELDGNGEAEVELPDYFEAINNDVHYQLTPIGAPAVLYVAQKVKDNRFRIAGGQPGMEVSWTVTGVRNDAFVRANPPRDVVEKLPQHKGKFLQPELFGMPSEMATVGIKAAKPQPALLRPSALPAKPAVPAAPKVIAPAPNTASLN